MNLNLSISDLSIQNVGSWPLLIKGVVITCICAAVLGLGYYFDTQTMIEELGVLQKKEESLKKEFETKQAKAANLEAYKIQMTEMEESFGTMLRQLPSKTEVADLLVDITQSGLANGLDFELFEPTRESPKDFYAELPIKIKVVGDYHEFGGFVSAVAALPRIVTLHDIKITSSRDTMAMDVIAKTYRYLDESEIQKPTTKKSKRKK